MAKSDVGTFQRKGARKDAHLQERRLPQLRRGKGIF